jgi:hypothetical protein
MPSYASLPHMAVLKPDTSYEGAPRPRMGISASTGYSTKALSPGHERVRQGINSSSRLALFDKTENTRQNRTREVAAASRRRSSTGAKPAPAVQFSGKPWVIAP